MHATHHTQAKELCEDRGLQGTFLNACAHDTAFSGDEVFVTSSAEDAEDFEFEKSSLDNGNGGGDGGDDGDNTSAASMLHVAGASLVGCVLLLSLLV